MRDRIRYRLQEIAYRLDLSREAWGRIGIAVGIAALISGMIVLGVTANINRHIDALHDSDSNLAQEIVDIENLNILDYQIPLSNWLRSLNMTLEDFADVLGIQAGELNLYHIQLIDALARLNAVEEAKSYHSLPESYLTGTFPDYTLYVKSGEASNFTANVHLAYWPAVGNATSYNRTLTEFYAGINFTASPPAYVPVITFNGTAWGTSEIWFNIGIYEIETLTKAIIPITCWGLNLTPSFAYVEVYSV